MQGGKTRLYVNSAYDQHTWLYTYIKNMLPGDPRYSEDSLGLFLPWKLALNKELYLPVDKITVPFEEYDVGVMKYGTSDPEDPAFNTLSDWYVDGKVLEVRIPWMMLGFTDPSSKLVWQTAHLNHLQHRNLFFINGTHGKYPPLMNVKSKALRFFVRHMENTNKEIWHRVDGEEKKV